MLSSIEHPLTLDFLAQQAAEVATYTDEQLVMKFYETFGMLAVAIKEQKGAFAVYGIAIAHFVISCEIQERKATKGGI